MDRNGRLYFYLGLMCLNYIAGAWQPFLLKGKTEDKLGGGKTCVFCINFTILIDVI